MNRSVAPILLLLSVSCQSALPETSLRAELAAMRRQLVEIAPTLARLAALETVGSTVADASLLPPGTSAPIATSDHARAATRVFDERIRIALFNIANADTPGFKRRQIVCRNGARPGEPVRVTERYDFEDGPLRSTQRSLDVAIVGPGFFKLQLPDGRVAYTRDGRFVLDAEGRLVSGAGHRLVPEIRIPQDVFAIGIGNAGEVTVMQASSPDVTTCLGQLQLSRFPNLDSLEPGTQGLWLPTPTTGRAIEANPGQLGLGTLRQNFLEESNVDLAEEVIGLLAARRSCKALQRPRRDPAPSAKTPGR